MVKYLLVALAFVAIAAVSVAGVQSSRLADVQADLANVEADLSVSESRRLGAESAHRETLSVLAGERAAAERHQATIRSLRDRIARDAGTDRDGPTAPVLRDTIKGIAG